MAGTSLKAIIGDDLFRYCGNRKFLSLISLYFRAPGFKYLFWFRITTIAREKGRLLYFILWLKLRKLQFKFGYDIPAGSLIAPGFYIGHFGGIVISPKAKIGKNCNISQNVTIGYSSRGIKKGYPTIHENVYIGPGAVIIGNIIIGKNVAVGANAFVNNDVPANAVVAGVPAKIVSYNGSEGYILNRVE